MTTCDSCGRDDAVVVAVRRQYPTGDDALGWRTLEEIEHWCPACCAHYPHEPAT